MKRALVLFFALAIVGLTYSGSYVRGRAQGQSNKFRPAVTAIPGQYVVVLNDSAPGAQTAALAESLASKHGGQLRFVYEKAIKGFSIKLPEQAAIALSRDPRVAYVEEDSINKVQGTQTAAQGPTTFFGLDRIDQRDLPLDNTYNWDRTGANVHAYVLDTGIWVTHDEFQGRASVSYDSFGGDGIDRHNHGTFVAGVIGGATYGVAKNVLLHAVKVCDDTGSCPTSNIIAGLNWVISNHASLAVVNMSIAGPASTSLDSAVRSTMAAGVLCVVGAGNDGVNASNTSPARVTEALTIAASLNNDSRASYSNFGPAVDLFAPGGQSPDQFIPVPASGWFYGGSNSATDGFTGTSAAAPHATGVAAMYLEANPGASSYVAGGELKKNASLHRISNAGAVTRDDLLFSNFPMTVSHLSGSTPLYRYYAGNNITDHFYTTNFNELGAGANGWGFEFVACYVFPTQQAGTTPLYQYWNPTVGDHFYTTNFGTLGNGAFGYTFERVVGYVYATQQPGTLPLYRYYSQSMGDHFYTTNFDELGNGRDGYVLENIECYVSQ
jgi:subtilisin family serine protease